MERTGLGKRLPALILDSLFLVVLIGIAVTTYAAVGGAKLGMEAQNALGVEVTWRSMFSDQVWTQYGRRIEDVALDLAKQAEKDFTPDQIDFLLDTFNDSAKDRFMPTDLSLRFFLDLDEKELNRMVDDAFDAVIEADRADIDPAKVNALRSEAKQIMDEFGIAKIVGRAMTFAIWLALLPALVILGYGFTEAISGRTLGKLAVGIGIRKADGERAYVSNLMLRYAIKNSGFLLVILALLTRLPVLFTVSGIAGAIVLIGSLAMIGSDKRALHDYLSSTSVFRIPRGGEL